MQSRMNCITLPAAKVMLLQQDHITMRSDGTNKLSHHYEQLFRVIVGRINRITPASVTTSASLSEDRLVMQQKIYSISFRFVMLFWRRYMAFLKSYLH